MCLFTLAMMAVSWPVWSIDRTIPRFPVAGLATLLDRYAAFEAPCIAACLAGLAASLFGGWLGRMGAAVAFVAGLMLVAFDQNRLQAWFYQTLVLSVVYALIPATSAVGFARFFAVALYVHSALSKLDWSFAHSMGPYLLSPLIDLSPVTLDARAQAAAALALPAGELAFAIALACGYRRIGLAGASIMHFGLLVLLGPWALGHSGNVLLWNVSMLIQAWILFRPAASVRMAASVTAESESRPSYDTNRTPDVSPTPPSALGLVQLGMLVVAILPFFERTGLWDPWPSFALYAGHVERLRIDWPAKLKADIPAEFRSFLQPVDGDLVLDLTLWSRSRMGVPPYPASRIHRRLAAWIALRCPPGMPMRATLESKAHWRTGQRRETTLSSAQAIRQ